MTEYGRGSGSEPWHPEDPLYGDQGWGGQQPAHGQAPYDGQYGAQQQYPQGQYDPYQQQAHDPYAQQQHPQHQQPQPPDPYAQQQYQQQAHDPYGQQQAHDPYAQQQAHDPYAQQPQQQPGYDTGWDTGGQAMPPYDGGPAATYGYGETNDYYGTPDAYPPPQPPGHREPTPAEAPEPARDWDPEEPPEETHPFFTGTDEKDDRAPKDDDYDDEDEDDPRESRRGKGGDRRGKGKKKNRGGCACLVLSVVLVAGVGGVGYFGYSFYQDRYGPAPDFSGSGSGSVEVEIPKGAFGNEIGNILKKAGVVKSVDAFVSAQNENPKGKSIQAGVYLLHSQMSASEAVKMMVDPKSQNLLVIPEGTRNVAIYALLDERLGLDKGTTKKIAKSKSGELGLPDWASKNKDVKDPLEGFLYPAAYPLTKETKPEAMLKKMVERSNEEYKKLDLQGTAKKYKLDGPWQVLTVASLVQAEGLTHDDFRKMAEVVYNRLKPNNTVTNRKLEFDSAYNYLTNQSKIKIGSKEIRTNPDPYNTYYHAGLPPGPIGNPGDEALRATLSPTSGGWMFFISLDGKKTQFTKTAAEHEKLNEKFKEKHGLQ
ncbi:MULTISPECIES: endolytic transglycosylase MltG [unclassified Streptomyces]|uniref:endolytic transglycosylase MltG n=1 Tax=unclassified Streptomyces TaxID=2593676 RepID=UPI000DAE6B77|nr:MULTISPECIES: endolytic transglycosylase MltG [unclassified Streptomyces]PZT74019.1 endolytic transglycosylase MltG [Streptomyces sp. AC1-42T]PZT82990.1 endolytic transglycosylase MltG [Streptomyces sp. AC1-42W]